MADAVGGDVPGEGVRRKGELLSWTTRQETVALNELEVGFAAMALDEEKEAEALEWCEALIGDVAEEA